MAVSWLKTSRFTNANLNLQNFNANENTSKYEFYRISVNFLQQYQSSIICMLKLLQYMVTLRFVTSEQKRPVFDSWVRSWAFLCAVCISALCLHGLCMHVSLHWKLHIAPKCECEREWSEQRPFCDFEFACSPGLCLGFLQVLQLLPKHAKTCMFGSTGDSNLLLNVNGMCMYWLLRSMYAERLQQAAWHQSQ